MKRYLFSIALCLCLVIACAFVFSACDGEGAVTYTVTFEENGGTPVENITGVSAGDTITLPQDFLLCID
ncbi:MAG: InlB B-repeat-containing protein [Clostridia bacterium]|nr:InlB B-repeat-containing protein [Clostridia bacterium]